MPLTLTETPRQVTDLAVEASTGSIDTKLTTTANGLKTDGSAVIQPVSGAVSVSNFPASQPVTFTSPASAAVTNVASSASSVQLLASNANRKGAIIYNDSTKILYVKFGVTASTSSYTVQVPNQGYFEVPFPVYTGEIDGIWAAANGNARITELT